MTCLISWLVHQGRIQGGFEGFVRTPPGWWVTLHNHATCGKTSKLIVFLVLASAISCNLQFCSSFLLFTHALSSQQADCSQPGIGPSGWTSCLGGLSAVNRRMQNCNPVVCRQKSLENLMLGEGGGGGFVDSQTSRSLDLFLSLVNTELQSCRLQTKNS